MDQGRELHSNLWIKIADDDFDKLKQVQMDYQLKSIEEVLEHLVNTSTINCLCKESYEYATKVNPPVIVYRNTRK
jgi:hypothetical protein